MSLALGLLLIPVLGFLGQCARIGAVHRDRRLAALRLAGAGPWQVRRIAALESGLACLAGAVVATATVAVPLLPYVTAWAGVVVVAVPVLGRSSARWRCAGWWPIRSGGSGGYGPCAARAGCPVRRPGCSR